MLLNSPTVAILNSRKPRRVSPSDRWISTTIALTEEAVRRGLTIVSSLGMLTYDLVTFMATRLGSPTIIVLDSLLPDLLPPDKQAEFQEKFAGLFDPEKTTFVSPFQPERKIPNRSGRTLERDRRVVSLACRVWVGEIRAGGNMEKLARTALKKGRRVQVFCPSVFDKFTSGNQALLSLGAEEIKPGNLVMRQSPCQLNKPQRCPAAANTLLIGPPFRLSEYLFHYTRSCYGPWPGQSWADYIGSLVAGDTGAAHTGFDTLCRILSERLIRASHRLVRGNVPVVSFSACLPTHLANIRKWNPALIRWTFEPYAVAIRKATLDEMGALPVIYGPEAKFQQLLEIERVRFQLHAPPKTDWSSEKEWRITGDIDLSHLSPEDLLVVVSTEHEALSIQEKFSLPVINLSAARNC
ncbi:MAG: hypothetical protein AB1797_13445 [bacterium]